MNLCNCTIRLCDYKGSSIGVCYVIVQCHKQLIFVRIIIQDYPFVRQNRKQYGKCVMKYSLRSTDLRVCKAVIKILPPEIYASHATFKFDK